MNDSWTFVGFALLTALIHIYIFMLESIFWIRPLGLKTFRMNAEQAATMSKMAFNQGFYNLFLALAILFGLKLGDRGQILVDYAILSICAAAVVLIISDRKMLRGAFIQGVPAFCYLILRFIVPS